MSRTTARPTQPGHSSRPRHTPPGPPPARAVALAALTLCLDRGLDVQPALDQALRSAGAHALAQGRPNLDERDSALATELVYGWLRRRATHDAILDRFLREPAKVAPALRRILGLAAHEIIFLDRIPAYASVNWAVDLAWTEAGPGAARLANAVLRRVSELGPAAREPEFLRPGAPSEDAFLARSRSCPEWIIGLWRRAYGPKTLEILLEAQAGPAPLGLRFNRTRPEALDLLAVTATRPEAILTDVPGTSGLALPASIPELHAWEASGLVSRQSLAAQEALAALEPESWPGPVWDACCGRGGKTTSLAERGLAPLWASDPSRKRLSGLGPEFDRLGLPRPLIFAAEAQHPPLRDADAVRPGTILLDAPCSGLGVLSRRPDAKWKRRPADLKRLAAIQARMLTAAFDQLAPGGRLAYVTCTLNPAENEERVKALLQARTGARVLRQWQTPFVSGATEFFFAALLGRF